MASVVRPESTWLIVIRGENVAMSDTESDVFLVETKEQLSRDACNLYLSRTSSRTIILRVQCPMVLVTDIDGDGRDEEVELDAPRLAHTLAYLYTRFTEQAQIIVERNAVLNGPSQWRTTETVSQMGYHVRDIGDYRESASTYTQYSAEWHLTRIDTRSPSQDRAYTYRNDAHDVDIYVLDTGIKTSHVDFEGRATFLHNAIRDNINTDCNGHGTHVAGIAGSRTFGVAKKASLFGVRVLNCSGNGILDDILEGADVIVDTALARAPRRGVINLSLGGAKNALLDVMIQNLRSHNLVVVLAAGNEATDACTLSPSNLGRDHYVMTVGASDRQDRRPWWSNYGACVGISAPGVDVVSTWHTSNTAIATNSGSSMSAPVVAGVAAMMLQEDPTLSVSQVNEMLIQWATPRVIGSTSSEGGGSSLVYSLIDPAVAVDELGQDNTLPWLTSDDSSTKYDSVSMLLCIAITLLYVVCLQ